MASSLTDEEVFEQIAAGRSRAARSAKGEPRAASARYDRRRRSLVVELTNKASLSIPARLVQGLSEASIEQLSSVKISPSGLGLRWEALDLDISVPALLQGMFGTREWMRHLGRVAGSARTEAKASAARKNGLKGGRPAKTACGVPCAAAKPRTEQS